MIQVSKLKENDKFHIVPVQDGIATWIDEVRFVEEMMENPLMLDRYVRGNGQPLSPYGEHITYKMLMNYGYSVLGLRGKDVKDFMFNTMRSVAVKYYELKLEQEIGSWFIREHEHRMKRSFDDWDSYGKLVCYGGTTHKEDTYRDRVYYETHTPMTTLQSQKTLNVWEFLHSVRPQTMTEDIVIYKDELDAILDLFGKDLHKIIIAYSMIVRAKLFESNRCYWNDKEVVDEKTGEVFKVSQTSQGKHWNTPCILERRNFGIRGRSSYLIYELGFSDRRGILNLYEEVLQEMFQAELFKDIGLLKHSNGGYAQISSRSADIFEFVGATPTYTIKDFDVKTKKVKLKRNRSAKTYLKVTSRKDLIGAYKPTFLTLHDDSKEVAFTIDYYTLTHGYVFELMVYLGNIKHISVERNKFRITTCEQCGERQLILMDGKKGKMPKYCKDCGSPKEKMRRKREKSCDNE